jgi:hypothetical protein
LLSKLLTMAVILIKSSGKEVPYNTKTAIMFERAIKSGDAEIIGEFEAVEKKKELPLEVAEVADVKEVEVAEVEEVEEKPKRGRKKKTEI